MPKGLFRFQKARQFHFITFSCYQRMPLLTRTMGYGAFERELETVRRRYAFVVAGYVLMPEHVHLLVSEPQVSTLAVVLQVLKQQTSRKLKRPGEAQFWQRRYFDFSVYNEEKTVEKLRYMHRNPVHVPQLLHRLLFVVHTEVEVAPLPELRLTGPLQLP